MKIILLALISCFLTLFSLNSLAADKITIKGQPVVIEQQGEVYVPATTTYTTVTTDDGYYFTVNNEKRVCYRTVQPGLASLDLGIFAVKLGPDTVSLHCYSYSPDYFVIE